MIWQKTVWRGEDECRKFRKGGQCRFTYLITDCTMGQNQVILRHQSFTFPRARGLVSERANEWAQRSAQAKSVMRSKRMSEQCERTSERTSEWPSTYVPIPGCSAPLWIVRKIKAARGRYKSNSRSHSHLPHTRLGPPVVAASALLTYVKHPKKQFYFTR